MTPDEWYLDQPIRLPSQQRGRVERLTPTLVVLADGSRWRRLDGRQSARSSRRIEPWSSEWTRSAQVAKRRAA
jgi:hypothetical protein